MMVPQVYPHPPIAQLAEQAPLKRKVPGSIPGGRTALMNNPSSSTIINSSYSQFLSKKGGVEWPAMRKRAKKTTTALFS